MFDFNVPTREELESGVFLSCAAVKPVIVYCVQCQYQQNLRGRFPYVWPTTIVIINPVAIMHLVT